MASILVLNQYFPPDPVSTAGHVSAIASRLAEEGHAVSVIAAQPSYQGGLPAAPARERAGGVEVTRVGVGPRRGRERMASRVEGYLRYLRGASRRARSLRPELILSFHNPPPLGLMASRAARRAGAIHIQVIQDIHPDIVLASGFVRLPRPAVRAWEAANRRVLAHADRTVVLGSQMKRTLVDEKGADPARVEVIPLWAEPELEPRPRDLAWRSAHGLTGELVVLCAGNMGIMHPLDAVLDAASKLDAGRIVFLLVGGGARRSHWQAETAARGLGDRVRFMDFQFGDDFAQLVAASDLALVPLAKGMERLALPARTFALLSAGCPVVALMSPDADVARIVVDGGAGWQVADAAGLAALLLRLSEDPQAVSAAATGARALFERGYTREAVTGEYASLVQDLLAESGA